MEFKDLKIFQSVAEHQSISKAATSLCYVQSYVTSRIKMLEQELNAQLFIRRRNGTTLTSEGVKLQIYAEQIRKVMCEIDRAFHDNEMPTGKLNIGTVETITRLPEILSKYQQLCSDVSLALYSGVTESIITKVRDRKLDCAFVTGFTKQVGINKVELFHEQLILIANQPLDSIDQLKSKSMLVFTEGCNYRKKLEMWLDSEHIDYSNMLEFGTLETIVGSVKSGLGVSLVPESTVTNDVTSQQLYAYRLPEYYSTISTDFIWNDEAYVTPAIDRFIQMIMDFKNLAPVEY